MEQTQHECVVQRHEYTMTPIGPPVHGSDVRRTRYRCVTLGLVHAGTERWRLLHGANMAFATGAIIAAIARILPGLPLGPVRRNGDTFIAKSGANHE